jgi:hypothetical protein
MFLTRSPFLAHYRTDFADWLNGPDFVVCQHDGDEHRVWPERRNDILNPDNPVLVNWKARNFPASLFELSTNSAN